MFDWFAEELELIQTPKFHLVEGEGDSNFKIVVNSTELRLADSYRKFVVRFGNSRLFRQSLFGYKLGVIAGPRKFPQHDSMYHIGYDDGKVVCLREDSETVFEGSSKKRVADSFEVWFEKTYSRIKSKYSNVAWNEIKAGPRPFDGVEAAIVNAREEFMWREVGFDKNGDRVLEIENTSDRGIPCLTLGVRSSDGKLNGAVVVNVGGLLPRKKGLFAIDCYKQFYLPDDLTLFDLPKPGPEDRNFLAELKRPKSDNP